MEGRECPRTDWAASSFSSEPACTRLHPPAPLHSNPRWLPGSLPAAAFLSPNKTPVEDRCSQGCQSTHREPWHLSVMGPGYVPASPRPQSPRVKQWDTGQRVLRRLRQEDYLSSGVQNHPKHYGKAFCVGGRRGRTRLFGLTLCETSQCICHLAWGLAPC